MVDASGWVRLARSYAPYGDPLSSEGAWDSPYGFAGEWTDASGLQYLRAEPSLGGAVLRKLAPGTRLTILEGPVEADGYTWWKMQTEDGSEGWAVEVGVWYQPVSGE